MEVEDRGVARGQHPDAVVDDGLGRVGAGGDDPERAVGRVLGEAEAVIAGVDLGLQDLRAGSLVDDEQVLRHLVGHPPEARLFDGQAAHEVDGLGAATPHVGDHPLAGLQRHGREDLEGPPRGRHRRVDVREQAPTAHLDVGDAVAPIARAEPTWAGT